MHVDYPGHNKQAGDDASGPLFYSVTAKEDALPLPYPTTTVALPGTRL